jgi:hypothetical protein
LTGPALLVGAGEEGRAALYDLVVPALERHGIRVVRKELPTG